MRLIDWRRGLRGEAPSSVRNKRGGMAWIKPFGREVGGDVLAGHIVKTTRFTHGLWLIEPPQPFTVKRLCFINGEILAPGCEVFVVSMCDELLEPIDEPGEDARDQSLAYYPPVPSVTRKPQEVTT